MTGTRMELNQAIWTVLNTKFKKDAKEVFKVVEAAGYSVFKNGAGQWEVSNPTTGRYVYLAERGWKYWTRTVIQHGPYTCMSRELKDEEAWSKTSVFDFIGCLEKPINKVWYELDRNDKLTAHNKYDNISFKRRMVKSYEDDIERIQKQIADLQKSLVSKAQTKVQYEMEVEKLRKEYGLA